MKMMPSAPTERWRRQTALTNVIILFESTTRSRLSTTMKSLPAPENFMKAIFFIVSLKKCRNRFPAHEIVVVLAGPDHMELLLTDQDFRDAGP